MKWPKWFKWFMKKPKKEKVDDTIPLGIHHTVVPKSFLKDFGNDWESDRFKNQIHI